MRMTEYKNLESNINPEGIGAIKDLIIQLTPNQYKDIITKIFLVLPIVKQFLSDAKKIFFKEDGSYNRLKMNIFHIRRLWKLAKLSISLVHSLLVIFGKKKEEIVIVH